MKTGFSRCISICLAIFVCGCLSRPTLVRENFAFTATSSNTKTNAENGPILGISRVFVVPQFDSMTFTYRIGEFSYERDPYAGFLVSPSESFAEAVRDALRNSGLFRDVPESGSALKPDVQLEISVPKLYGDFRDRANPAAVLEMRFVAFKSSDRTTTKIVLQKNYARKIPLTARTAAALVAGWNDALNQISTEFARDLADALK